jgi:integrase/recombinase XerD
VKGFSQSTLRVRRVHMEMFLKWCRRSRILAPIQITRKSLEDYQRYLFQYRKKNGQPLAVASQHARLAPLKVWFKWLAYRKYVATDPAAELELPRVEYKLPSVLNKDEAERVLSRPNVGEPLGIRDRAMLEILYSSGLRRMELLNLKLYDIDQKHGLVTVRQGKGKRDRVVPIGQRALAWLDVYLKSLRPEIAKKPDDGIIFLTSNGVPFTPNHLSWLARQYVKSAAIGKNGACHISRHTMATLMLEGGGRLLSEDPLGFDGEDANFYAYVGNNPTAWTDPDGLRKYKCTLFGGCYKIPFGSGSSKGCPCKGGARLPDFVSTSISIAVPWTGGWGSWTLSGTLDRYGRTYWSPIGPGLGRSGGSVSGTVVPQWSLQKCTPGPDQLSNLLSGHGLSGAAGYGGGVGVSCNKKLENCAAGAGLVSPQIGGNYSYSFSGPDIKFHW